MTYVSSTRAHLTCSVTSWRPVTEVTHEQTHLPESWRIGLQTLQYRETSSVEQDGNNIIPVFPGSLGSLGRLWTMERPRSVRAALWAIWLEREVKSDSSEIGTVECPERCSEAARSEQSNLVWIRVKLTASLKKVKLKQKLILLLLKIYLLKIIVRWVRVP